LTRVPECSESLWRVLTEDGDPFSESAQDIPVICLNMVMSVDGATTIAGRVGALTGPADQGLLRRLRAEADAVLVGARTVRVEGYGSLLGPEERRQRTREQGSPEPLLCVVSGRLSLPDASPALGESPSPLVFLTSSRDPLPRGARPVAAIRSTEGGTPSGTLRLRPLLHRLREEFGVEKIVCEGGATLNAALFAEDLVQELFVSLSPRLAQEAVSPRILEGDAPVSLRLVGHAACEDFVFLRYRRSR
jgi:riboflavin biosynthesis pyrimidine reductase